MPLRLRITVTHDTRTRNAADRVYTGQHGASSILRITGRPATGLHGAIWVAVPA